MSNSKHISKIQTPGIFPSPVPRLLQNLSYGSDTRLSRIYFCSRKFADIVSIFKYLYEFTIFVLHKIIYSHIFDFYDSVTIVI